MVSAFGKQMRILRINLGITMRDMAKALGVSSAFISSLELNKKKVPESFVKKLQTVYDLSDEIYDELVNAADMANGEIKIFLGGYNEIDQKNFLKLARGYNTLTPENKEALMALINNEE